MRVCHIVPSLEDRHGGPSRSVRALANAQATLGDAVELLATLEAGQPVTAGGPDAARVQLFPRVAPRWLSRSPELRHYLAGTTADCVHHHALWLLPLHYAQETAFRRGAPLVISPRGMLSGWAYQHRRWRKLIAEIFIHPGAFARAAGWHATSPEEAADIRALGFKQPICVSPNGVNRPTDDELAAARRTWLSLCPAAQHRPVALFYSRFHRKKRVKELIDLWLSVPRGDWLLLVVGVAEDYTAAELAATITAAGASDHIKVHEGAGLPPPYAVASLFLLPSHSENFGLVIAEALAAGVPALVTNTTPWSGLAAHGCGWCVGWREFGDTLSLSLTTKPTELKAMGRRGRAWVDQYYSWPRAAALLHDFYQGLLNDRG